MSKNEKLMDKIKNNPTNVKFETLQKILLKYGFDERKPRGGSSHYTYAKDQYILTIPKNKPVNKIYVKKFIELIEKVQSES